MAISGSAQTLLQATVNYYYIYYHIIMLLSQHKSLLSISTTDSVSLQTRISDACHGQGPDREIYKSYY